jgi:DNA-directed RNA polymerase subunit RPC12/RpoP
MFLVEMMRRLMGRTLACPHCGHRQQAQADGRRRERCEKCGAPLPASRDDGRGVKG